MRPLVASPLPGRRSRARAIGGSTSPDTLPDMTPMVDVVMVILIFFMASTALVGPELLLRARIAPEPQQEAADAPLIAPAALVVRLESGPSGPPLATGLGLQRTTPAALIARIDARADDLRAGEIPIIIQSDDAVPYQSVVDIIAALERAGVRDIAIR